MLNEQGPFSKCLKKIPGEGHHESCVYDVCSNTGHVTLMKQLACDALSVMAMECKAVGATPEGWQQIAGCGIVFSIIFICLHFGSILEYSHNKMYYPFVESARTMTPFRTTPKTTTKPFSQGKYILEFQAYLRGSFKII